MTKMTKEDLQEILSEPFSQASWTSVLATVFSVKRRYLQPRPVVLPANDKADKAFKWGSFDTADDRLIGL